MTEAPLRMECYDISHLQGTNVVASMVVFEDGLPRKDQYRRYTIAETTDDTDSMYQVLTRRLARLDEDAELPDVPDVTSDEVVEGSKPTKRFAYRPQLLIVDGGQPQVAGREARDGRSRRAPTSPWSASRSGSRSSGCPTTTSR